MSVREWLLEQDGGDSGIDTLYIDDNCELTGRGVKTKKRINPGTKIISIPMMSVLTGNVGFTTTLDNIN